MVGIIICSGARLRLGIPLGYGSGVVMRQRERGRSAIGQTMVE